MRPTISYIQDHGWHAGRLLWWPVLVLLGQPVGILAAGIDLGLRALTGVDAPFVLLSPMAMGLVAWSRVRRLRSRGVVVVDRVFRIRDMRVDTVRRALEPERFTRWVRIDACLWAGAVAAWAVLPVALLLSERR
ncbi:MAG: hypothetical protein IT355_20495 [Gemmatimonadaceae bacterium]|nr:hypothetical protein [Gemmatimonadaceae bacterium]